MIVNLERNDPLLVGAFLPQNFGQFSARDGICRVVLESWKKPKCENFHICFFFFYLALRILWRECESTLRRCRCLIDALGPASEARSQEQKCCVSSIVIMKIRTRRITWLSLFEQRFADLR